MRKTKTLWFTVFAVIIALTMAATVFMAAGFAEDTPEDGYVLVGNIGKTSTDNVALYYNASTKTAKISGNGSIKNFNPDNAYFLDTSSLPVKDAESVIIEDGIQNISENFFRSSKIESVIIPNSVTEIGKYAFYNCASLRSLTLPDNMTSIGEYAFSGCTSLSEIAVPDGVQTLGDGIFEGCTALTKVTLPGGLKVIPARTFYNCAALQQVGFGAEDTPADGKIVFPDGLTRIEDYAFEGCSQITSVSFPQSARYLRGIPPTSHLTEMFFCRNSLAMGVGDDFHGTIYTCWSSEAEFSACTGISRFSNSYTIIPNYHNMVFIPEKPATWKTPGVKAHYECTRCGGNFSDADGMEELYEVEIPVPKNAFAKFLNIFQRIFYWLKSLFAK